MSVLDLPTAKAHLNITVPAYDTEVAAFIDTAEAVIAQRVGPLSPSTVTDRVAGYAWNLWLPAFPVVSLTSVTPVGGTALTVGSLFLDTDDGAVSYTSGAFFGSPAYDVVYVAGRATVPPDLLAAVKELLRHLWTTQRGPVRSSSTDEITTGQSYSLPNRVLELTEPHERRQKTLGA